MKKAPLFLLLVSMLFPSLGSAQRWTAEEQGLIDHMKMCWDAWIEAQPEGSPDGFFQKCPYSEGATMWWTEFNAPQTPERIRREWDYSTGVDLAWIDLQPVSVRIWGDFGMVQFYGTWKAQTTEGPVTTEYKRTELYRKIDGTWVFLGGQGTPSTARDAEPYG